MRSILLVLLILMMGACGSSKNNFEATYSADPKLKVLSYKTYTIEPEARLAVSGLPNNQLLQNQLNEAIRKAMERQGYQYTTGKADLVVRYLPATLRWVEQTNPGMTTPYYNPYDPYYRGLRRTTVREMSEDRLYINVYEGNTNRLVWKGRVSFQSESKNQTRSQLLNASTSEILKNFPKSTL